MLFRTYLARKNALTMCIAFLHTANWFITWSHYVWGVHSLLKASLPNYDASSQKELPIFQSKCWKTWCSTSWQLHTMGHTPARWNSFLNPKTSLPLVRSFPSFNSCSSSFLYLLLPCLPFISFQTMTVSFISTTVKMVTPSGVWPR